MSFSIQFFENLIGKYLDGRINWSDVLSTLTAKRNLALQSDKVNADERPVQD